MDRLALIARMFKTVIAIAAAASVLAVVGLVIVPRALGLREAAVLSDSMWPAVPSGALVLIDPLGGRVPQAGDIIAFQRPDKDHSTVTRRVFVVTDHLGGPTIWTKADTDPAPDPWALRPDQVTGRVQRTIPRMGRFARWLHTPFGLALALGVPLGLGLLQLAGLVERQRRGVIDTQTLIESRLRRAYRG
jgi:signal peptidase